MAVTLILPGRRITAPKPPSRIALDMAFGVGAGAVLGDKSRYNSHGAITTATWVAGVHGMRLNFVPGNPDYVTIPAANTQLDFTAEDFSIVCRLRIDDRTVNRTILNRGVSLTDGYVFLVLAGGQLLFVTSQAALNQQTASIGAATAINTEYTIGMSRIGADVTIYRNGIDITGIAGVHIDPLTAARDATIGIRADLVSNPWDGQIEFFRIFRNVALTTSEHLAWHNALA